MRLPPDARKIAAECRKRGRDVAVMVNHEGDVGVALVEDLEAGREVVLQLPRRYAKQLLVDLRRALEP